jgi:isopentenyl-diphosphate Delta-isomerase
MAGIEGDNAEVARMTAESDQVVLVDRDDIAIGTTTKMLAHTDALLHRAFSVFIFDKAGNVLLQRRADTKYHSAGLWSNACCSHPRPDEEPAAAASRRLREEMGFECTLRSAFAFVYRADVGNGLVEHEYDHVFIGGSDVIPRPDPEEVSDWKWVSQTELTAELRAQPASYTYWLRIAWEELLTRGLVRAARWPRLARV